MPAQAHDTRPLGLTLVLLLVTFQQQDDVLRVFQLYKFAAVDSVSREYFLETFVDGFLGCFQHRQKAFRVLLKKGGKVNFFPGRLRAGVCDLHKNPPSGSHKVSFSTSSRISGRVESLGNSKTVPDATAREALRLPTGSSQSNPLTYFKVRGINREKEMPLAEPCAKQREQPMR